MKTLITSLLLTISIYSASNQTNLQGALEPSLDSSLTIPGDEVKMVGTDWQLEMASQLGFEQGKVLQAFAISVELDEDMEFTDWGYTNDLIDIRVDDIIIHSDEKLILYIKNYIFLDGILNVAGIDSDEDYFIGRMYSDYDEAFVLEVYYPFGAFSYRLR